MAVKTPNTLPWFGFNQLSFAAIDPGKVLQDPNAVIINGTTVNTSGSQVPFNLFNTGTTTNPVHQSFSTVQDSRYAPGFTAIKNYCIAHPTVRPLFYLYYGPDDGGQSWGT